jgi:hypothetical protein
MKRIKDLIAKLVSVKGFVFFSACALLAVGKLDQTGWLGAAVLFVGGRAYEKMLDSKRGKSD